MGKPNGIRTDEDTNGIQTDEETDGIRTDEDTDGYMAPPNSPSDFYNTNAQLQKILTEVNNLANRMTLVEKNTKKINYKLAQQADRETVRKTPKCYHCDQNVGRWLSISCEGGCIFCHMCKIESTAYKKQQCPICVQKTRFLSFGPYKKEFVRQDEWQNRKLRQSYTLRAKQIDKWGTSSEQSSE